MITKKQGLEALGKYPHSPDIKKYGYFMTYAVSNCVWYGCYDSDKGGVWYWWDKDKFKMCESLGFVLPKDTIDYDTLCELVNG